MSATLSRLFHRAFTRTGHPALAIRRPLPVTVRSGALAHLPLAASRAKSTKATEQAVVKSKAATTAKKVVSTKAAAKKVAPGAAKKTATSTRKTAATASKKAAPKKPAKIRKLTEDQKLVAKEKRQDKKFQEEKRLRKELALKPPVKGLFPLSSFNAFVAESTRGMSGRNLINTETVGRWKTLSESEKAKYDEIAKAKTEAKVAEYKTWIESYTLEQIKTANTARRWLKDHQIRTDTSILKDHRMPKKPVQSFLAFYVQNEFPGSTLTEKSKAAGASWKALSEAEKKPYKDLAATDQQRFRAEYKAASLAG